MVKQKLSATIVFLFSIANLYGQATVHGKILNSRTKEVIQYANIGIVGANVGTISNPDGSFSLSIPGKMLSDTLVFSSIGYEKRSIPLTQIFGDQSLIIYLSEKVMELSPVIISNRKVKSGTFQLGNPDFKGGVLETDTLYAGRSISLLIDDKSAGDNKGLTFPAYIENARLRIFKNNLKSCKFRIRINSVNKATGQPADDLLNESIVVESTMRKGWMVFDLSKLDIEISESFFLTFEQILDVTDRSLIADDYAKFMREHPDRLQIDTVEIDGKKEAREIMKRGGIDLAGTFIGIATSKTARERYTCYVRETSFGEWKKVYGIVAATVTCSK
jgi:hypothetical protein